MNRRGGAGGRARTDNLRFTKPVAKPDPTAPLPGIHPDGGATVPQTCQNPAPDPLLDGLLARMRAALDAGDVKAARDLLEAASALQRATGGDKAKGATA